MGVEADAAATFDAPLNTNTDTSSDMDAAMGAVWDKFERDNGAGRDDSGRFASDRADSADQGADAGADGKEPLEGGGGEEGADAVSSTPADVVPLPPSLRGLDDVWKEIPAHLQKPLAEHQAKLHKTLSEQGQQLSTFKPIGDTIQEFKEYFGGERGSYQPAEAIKELFTIQRNMDANPLGTLLDIAKRYELLPHLAKVFSPATEGTEGGSAAPANTENAALLAEVSELKRTIADMASKADPSKMDERISQKLMEDRQLTGARDAINRTSKDMPLFAEVPEDDMVHFINRAWRKLGDTATQDAVLKSAYDMAVNADPDLRARAAALKSAAANDPLKVAEAKRANATNLRSTSTGKPRERTEDEALGDVWDKHKKG